MTLITEPTLHVLGMLVPRGETGKQAEQIDAESASDDVDEHAKKNFKYSFHVRF